jgi:hypothetical protein
MDNGGYLIAPEHINFINHKCLLFKTNFSDEILQMKE